MTRITIWGRLSSCNVQKALWALEEVGVDYARIDAGGDFGGLDTPEFLAMNPTGQIPVLRDGDVTVWESDAVVRYLAARYGGDALWSEDPAERTRVDQWMSWATMSLYPDWIDLFWKLVRTPPDRRDLAAIRGHAERTAARLTFLDHQLADRPYIAGDRFTIADIPAGMVLYRWFEMELDRPSLPNVEAWYQRLRLRPSYMKSICIPFDDLKGREVE